MWWLAMRILSVPTVSAVVDESQVLLLNPWEPHPMQRGKLGPLCDDSPQKPQPTLIPAPGSH